MNQTKRESGITALYERLSRDDDSAGESNSIQNQKRYLEDYARQHGFTNIRHYSDDGYTGTNFNRPGFMQMLADIDAGLISTVIVKDMSRFGRNYLEVGLYTEIHFPEKGVRFIAINSNVDSDNPTENEFTPFLNVINEWYAKDTSRKICAIFKSRMSEGLRCSGSVPYGYIRLQGDKQTLVVDDEAAAVVRRIFELAAQGMNAPGIARMLTEEKILIPSAYAASITRRQSTADRTQIHVCGPLMRSAQSLIGRSISAIRFWVSQCESTSAVKSADQPHGMNAFSSRTRTRQSSIRTSGIRLRSCGSDAPGAAPAGRTRTCCSAWLSAQTAARSWL